VSLALPLRAVDPSPTPEKTDPDMEATLVPEKTELIAGEPVCFSFAIMNKLPRDLVIYGWFTTHGVNPAEVSMYAFDGHGKVVPGTELLLDQGGGPRPVPVTIPASGNFTQKSNVPMVFSQPGVYSVEASGQILDRDTMLKATATIKVLPPDNAKMGNLIDNLVKTASHGSGKELNDSDEKLLAINDDRVIPYLRELMRAKGGIWRAEVVFAFGKFESADALDCIKECLDSDPAAALKATRDPRAYAAYTLLQTPNPGAIPLLLTYHDDPDVMVCSAVMEALLNKIPPKQAIPILREMAKRKNKEVSDAAQQCLDHLSRKD
jgi:hypothetical protein